MHLNPVRFRASTMGAPEQPQPSAVMEYDRTDWLVGCNSMRHFGYGGWPCSRLQPLLAGQ